MAAPVQLRTPGERSYAAAQWRFLNGGADNPITGNTAFRTRTHKLCGSNWPDWSSWVRQITDHWPVLAK